MTGRLRTAPRTVGGIVILAACLAAAPFRPAHRAGPPRFEKDVLPILTARCVKCHGGQEPKAKLDLRTRAAMLRGGESGPALVPGSSKKSLVYEMVHKGEMPPKGEKLTAAQAAVIRAWVDAGAPAAEGGAEDAPGKVTEKDRAFWAFRKPVRPAVPAVRDADRVRNPIDAFVLAKLEAKKLTLSPDADRATLLRRLAFDLTGLPPTPEEVDAFVADKSPDAYEKVVDRLLASPAYGERWGRHWLDAAGYADTVGGDNDAGQVFPREGMYRYRDYVVRAHNEDRPFDRFVTEQLAGDEMEDHRNAAVLTPRMRELLTATGLLRVTVDHTTEQELNRPFERYQVLHDTIEILTSNLLGLTVGCARCHDHKFDPIPQAEYYQFLAVLKPVYNPERWVQPQNRHLPDVSQKEKEAIDRHNADLDRQAAGLARQAAVLRRPAEKKLYEAKLAALPPAIRADTAAALATPAAKRDAVQKYLAEKLGPSLKVSPEEAERSLAAKERDQLAALRARAAALGGQRRTFGKLQAAWEEGAAPPTFVFRRGNHATPAAEVKPGFFSVLTDPKGETTISPAKPGSPTSGRRTAWARWLTRPDHPLTARVFVNRVWLHHFGEGIVSTPDNFGQLGARPTHPELLDWLATEFVRTGWSVKALHRLIVTSSAYRQSSAHRDGTEADPGNQLLWRTRLRRLESEAIRDAVLAVSGRLDRTLGGPPVPIEPKASGLVVIPEKEAPAAARRSVYLFARRNYNLTLLGVFDQPVMATNCVRRVYSAVPLQSLTLLNDPALAEHADHFAARVASAGSAEGQVERAFRIAFARSPTAKEAASSLAFLKKARAGYAEAGDPPARAERKALARLCHMLMCANEFLYVG